MIKWNKIRIFGSANCDECTKVFQLMKALQWDYEYVDAFADDTQYICDSYDIDKLPHIQFLNEKGIIIFKCIGLEELKKEIGYLVKVIT